jgi:mRNA-degrading endonuclease HigB of HigAB toxin-antitoxin module
MLPDEKTGAVQCCIRLATKHRLVVWINYDFRTVYVRFVGTHKEYDGIDAQTV